MAGIAAAITAPEEKETPDQGGRAKKQISGRKSYQTGRRKAKAIAAVKSVRLLWPTTAKDQRELADEWHAIAMQIVAEARYSFRLLAVIPKFIHWQTGSLFPSNKTLAERAGRCSEDTISLDVSALAKFGLLQIEDADRPGSNFKRRILWLSLPLSVADTVSVTDDDVDADTVSVAVADTVSVQPKNRPLNEETAASRRSLESWPADAVLANCHADILEGLTI